jgi:hypothetical protein
MERFFNTAGHCNQRLHYMLPWAERIPNVENLIEQELYFVIHAPRQVGKTGPIKTGGSSLTVGVPVPWWRMPRNKPALIEQSSGAFS